MKIIKKDGQEYISLKGNAIPITRDKNGHPTIKPVIERKKDKNGKEHVIVKIPALKIKLKSNG